MPPLWQYFSHLQKKATADRLEAASALQATGLRGDATRFRLKAAAGPRSGLQPAFLWNPAERGYISGEAHNPEVAGSNPAPATAKGPHLRAFRVYARSGFMGVIWTRER
jgi:hypothetical protein